MRLRHRIDIQNDTSTASSESPIWSNLHLNVPANVVPVTGDENFRGEQIEATVDAKFEMVYRDGITADMRFVKQNDTHTGGTRTYNIRRVIPKEGRRRRLIGLAQEVSVNDGNV